jgi:hypothetical protein
MLSIIEVRAIIIDLRFSNKPEMGETQSLKPGNRKPVRDERKVPNTIDLPFDMLVWISYPLQTSFELSYDPFI